MTTMIGSFEAKTRLSELLKRVESGERITITNHGRPVAHLVPVKVAEITPDWSAFWAKVDSRKLALGNHESIKAAINLGRS